MNDTQHSPYVNANLAIPPRATTYSGACPCGWEGSEFATAEEAASDAIRHQSEAAYR